MSQHRLKCRIPGLGLFDDELNAPPSHTGDTDAPGERDPKCSLLSFPNKPPSPRKSCKDSNADRGEETDAESEGEEHEIDEVLCYDRKERKFVVQWTDPAPGEQKIAWVKPSALNPAAWEACGKKAQRQCFQHFRLATPR